MRDIRVRTAMAVLIGAVLVALIAAEAEGADSAALAAAWVDDGSCEDALLSLSAEYRHEAEDRRAVAYVRTAPAGGDCRAEAVSYDVEIEQRFASAWSADALIKIGAAARSASAVYALAGEDGAVLARGDGSALFSAPLPAGRAETVSAVLGAGWTLGAGLQVDAGVNIVPTDWADGSSGRTAHLGLTAEIGRAVLDVGIDAGSETYGDAALVWTAEGGATAALRWAWGLDVLDAGAPAAQTVGGAPFVLAGAPKSTALILELGIRFGL